MSLLLRRSHQAQQVSVARVGTQGVEQKVSLQTRQQPITLLISGVEPPESLIFISQVGIQGSNPVSRRVPSLALQLPNFNAFG
jgi:hypothetical protein